MNRNDPEFFNCTCPICGKKFHLKPYSLKRAVHHCCSRECGKKMKSQYFSGELNHQYGLKGSLNSSWKSDTRLSRYGYIQVRVLDHPFRDKAGFVLEHRLVAEKYLLDNENSVEIKGKKYLKPELVVHHINFDRTDNSVENLMIMTSEEHTRLHCKLNPTEKEQSSGKFAKSEGIVKLKRTQPSATIPKRATNGSNGYDLCVDTEEDTVIMPGESKYFDTHIAMELPEGYFGAIYSRSGISCKRGIRLSTCVSVIDSDYRGSISLYLYNDSNEPRVISPHERVAQLVIQKSLIVDFEVVDELSETERGTGGIGSTGK